MAHKLTHLVIVDIEATCWQTPKTDTDPLDRQPEIIEIGLAVLDMRAMTVGDKWSTLVAPRYSQVSPYCTSITNITPEMLAGAPSLEQACETLARQFTTLVHPWASWGDFDREQFVRQCARDKVKYPFGRTHFNLKSLFGLVGSSGKEVSMMIALGMLGLKLRGNHHRAGDDAFNTACMAREIFKRLKSKAPPNWTAALEERPTP